MLESGTLKAAKLYHQDYPGLLVATLKFSAYFDEDHFYFMYYLERFTPIEEEHVAFYGAHEN